MYMYFGIESLSGALMLFSGTGLGLTMHLEKESMIQHTRDIEMIAVCTYTNHQSIVRHLIVVVGV